MGKTKNVHSNQNRNKKHHNHQGRQRHTAIVFDQKQRDAYLKGIFGAKNRRKQYNKNKFLEQQKQAQKEDKAQRKANRREELQKAKQLLFKLQENHKKQDDKFEEKEVIVKQEGNIIVETKFY